MNFRTIITNTVIVGLLASTHLSFSQNVDRETATFEYLKLPSKPLGKDLKGYTAKVIQNDLKKNVALKEEYNKKMAQADADYNQKNKAAEDKAKADKAEANKTKVTSVINALQKKEPQPVIYKEQVETPLYYKEFSADVLANQYVNLNGYKKGANDIEIVVVLEGFEISSPTFAVNSANQHSYSITYKNPVNMKVSVGGTVVTDMLIPSTGDELKYTSTNFATKGEAESNWYTNRVQLNEKLQTESANKSLSKVNFTLNDLHGITKTKREADIYTVKNKKGGYEDVVAAYTELNEGLLSLGEDLLIEEGKTKIKAACEKFEVILKESNITDKKARINQDVTTAILFDLIEANIWLNEYVKVQKFMLKLKSNNINGREERRLEELKEFMTDHKARFDANKI